jgi:hypothetical protein
MSREKRHESGKMINNFVGIESGPFQEVDPKRIVNLASASLRAR